MSENEKTFDGQCYCGAVKIVVTGDPVGAGYCHCASCRSWSAGPVNAFTLWKPEAVSVTQGEDQIGEYHNNERSYRRWCKACGGYCSHATAVHLVHVYAATILDYASPPPALYELRGRHGGSAEDELAQWREAFIDLGW